MEPGTEGSRAFITYLGDDQESRKRLRLAVKDLIDVKGTVTSCGNRSLFERGVRAQHDAGCLAGARHACVQIVGKTNTHEFGMGATGINPWFGTPVNPYLPNCVPGGSSSGSAVSVAEGTADLAYGTDTGGSVRIPAACCGVFGLRPTHGRVSLSGVNALSPSQDTVGPLARTLPQLELAMRLLDPGLGDVTKRPWRVARVVLPEGVHVDPDIDRACDEALARHPGISEIREIPILGWQDAHHASEVIAVAESANVVAAARLEESEVGPDVRRRIETAEALDVGELVDAQRIRGSWTARLLLILQEFDFLALPTLPGPPPRCDEPDALDLTLLTRAASLAGLPALSVPVPARGPLKMASLQMIGAPRSEELLLAAARGLPAYSEGRGE